MNEFHRRFLPKVRVTGPGRCWEWLAFIGSGGYGRFRWEGRLRLAYGVAYEQFIGPIPAGLSLDHLCRNRACVNPWHLEPVTAQENALRGEGIPARNARKTHCPKGHPYDAINTYMDKRGCRYCRICRSEIDRRRYLAQKERAA